MKKWMAWLLAMAMLLGLMTGCAQKQAKEPVAEEPAAEAPAEELVA